MKQSSSKIKLYFSANCKNIWAHFNQTSFFRASERVPYSDPIKNISRFFRAKKKTTQNRSFLGTVFVPNQNLIRGNVRQWYLLQNRSQVALLKGKSTDWQIEAVGFTAAFGGNQHTHTFSAAVHDFLTLCTSFFVWRLLCHPFHLSAPGEVIISVYFPVEVDLCHLSGTF